MPDLAVRGMTFEESTVVPSLISAPQHGFLPLSVLQHHAVFMDAGPTGASLFWPEWFGFVHPELATTDVSLNLVDNVWLSSPGQRMWIRLPDAVQTTTLAAAVQKVREATGLPANDVAAMLGVKRRRLYDLLDGESAPADRERWIHALAGFVGELDSAASGDTARVRAALLRPDADGRSLFDLAVRRDEPTLRRRTEAICSELRRGSIAGYVQRPSPSLKRRGVSSAEEFLSGYRERDERRD